MNTPSALHQRLKFLQRVTEKECTYLLATDRRLFEKPDTLTQALQSGANSVLTERLEAFVSRFGRLQDTVGDKLLPALLVALAETPGAAIDNLDKAEKFGFIPSADQWMEMRHLRNQMVHEYIEDLSVLSSALRTGHQFVPSLVDCARRCISEAHRVLQKLTPS